MVVNCCKECGKLFKATLKLAYCPNHAYLDNEQFDKIVDYLVKNPYSNALQVNANTDVPIKDILRYIDEGKLSVINEKIYLK